MVQPLLGADPYAFYKAEVLSVHPTAEARNRHGGWGIMLDGVRIGGADSLERAWEFAYQKIKRDEVRALCPTARAERRDMGCSIMVGKRYVTGAPREADAWSHALVLIQEGRLDWAWRDGALRPASPGALRPASPGALRPASPG